MAKKTKGIPVDYASLVEVEYAISKLSSADAERLHQFATFKAMALTALGLGIDAEDLIQEAMWRTATGKRRWPKHITFVKYLIESVRSVASHAIPASAKGVTMVSSDPANEDEESSDEWSPQWEPVSQMPDAECIAMARDRLSRIEKRFENDERVQLIMEGLSTGMTGPEIKEDLGISQTELETAMTRLRRGARKEED